MATNEDIMQVIGQLQGQMGGLTGTLEGIKKYMGQQIDQHANTNARLAVIERVQGDMQTNLTNYTKECSAERTDFKERIVDMEGFRKRQLRTMGYLSTGVAAGVSTLFLGAVEWFKR